MRGAGAFEANAKQVAAGSAQGVFSPELVLVCPELRDEAFALLDEPWLVRTTLEIAPAAPKRVPGRSRPRWPLVGVFLLFASILGGAAWNIGDLSLPGATRDASSPAPDHTSAGGGPRPALRAAPRASGSLGEVVQRKNAGATAAPTRSVPRIRHRLVDRASIAGGGFSWRGGHFLVAPDGLTVTRFSVLLCAGLGPLPEMRIDARGRFGLRRTVRDVHVRLVGTFVTDDLARGTITVSGTGCAKNAVFRARIS